VILGDCNIVSVSVVYESWDAFVTESKLRMILDRSWFKTKTRWI